MMKVDDDILMETALKVGALEVPSDQLELMFTLEQLRNFLKVHTEKMPEPCDGKEQEAFESYVKYKGYSAETHPLHYIFLDPKANAARGAWSAAIRYCRNVLLGETISFTPGVAHPNNSQIEEKTVR